MKHIHADGMIEYAEDAMKSELPWTNWESCSSSGVWMPLIDHPRWKKEIRYRRKLVKVSSNGF